MGDVFFYCTSLVVYPLFWWKHLFSGGDFLRPFVLDFKRRLEVFSATVDRQAIKDVLSEKSQLRTFDRATGLSGCRCLRHEPEHGKNQGGCWAEFQHEWDTDSWTEPDPSVTPALRKIPGWRCRRHPAIHLPILYYNLRPMISQELIWQMLQISTYKIRRTVMSIPAWYHISKAGCFMISRAERSGLRLALCKGSGWLGFGRFRQTSTIYAAQPLTF